jgi:hypothetical protein
VYIVKVSCRLFVQPPPSFQLAMDVQIKLKATRSSHRALIPEVKKGLTVKNQEPKPKAK